MGKHALLADVDVAVILIFVTFLGTAWMARGYNVQQCKIEAFAEKQKIQEELSKNGWQKCRKNLKLKRLLLLQVVLLKQKKLLPVQIIWKHLCSNQSGSTINDS